MWDDPSQLPKGVTVTRGGKTVTGTGAIPKAKDPAAPKRGSAAMEPYKHFKKRTGTTLPNQGKGKKAK